MLKLTSVRIRFVKGAFCIGVITARVTPQIRIVDIWPLPFIRISFDLMKFKKND